jgi:hypothetical protein
LLRDEINKEFFYRLHVSQAVKDRVLHQFKAEQNNTGNCEWSLSQALTNIGTHFYGRSRDKHHQNILTSVGSKIIDNSLNKLLEAPVKKERYGEFTTFGLLLPKYFNLN